MRLEEFDLLTFDCYGTLIDWETGILVALRSILGPAVANCSDEELLQLHARHETVAEAGEHLAYREVLGRVLEGIAAEADYRLRPGQREELAESVAAWPAFGDTVTSLQRLARRYRLGVLSNIDDDLFAATQPRLGVELDPVVTAQQVGSYKPAPGHFEVLLQRIEVPSERILHVAQSLFHDIAPARRIGLSTVWVNRRSGKPGSGATPPSDAVPDLEVPDLRTLADVAGV